MDDEKKIRDQEAEISMLRSEVKILNEERLRLKGEIQTFEEKSKLNEQTKPKVVYISGPMSGKPNYNLDAFCLAAVELRAAGYIVLNPSVLPVGMDDVKYMPICIAMLDAADAIFLLDGWPNSVGARIEEAYAVRQGKKFLYRLTPGVFVYDKQ